MCTQQKRILLLCGAKEERKVLVIVLISLIFHELLGAAIAMYINWSWYV